LTELRTGRLLLRQWRDDDYAPFAALNADHEVMRHFPRTMSRAESDALADGQRGLIDERGWGLWAVEAGDEGFIGFVGLSIPRFEAHFMPAVEIGWRLARHGWGKGYATEAARAGLDFGFGELGLDEIVSFTAVVNDRSRRVMERLGMTHDPGEDFDHPVLPEGDTLRRHVLYRLGRDLHWTRAGDP
jgi:RimJ/RimL family protein N-acetyltransferase